jgi:cyclopropane fatty-acyl-phospholipid synthase-like methyltransferase
MSVERADRIARELASNNPGTVADFGCGWGQLMFRVLENAPDATAVGYEIHGPDVVRGRAEAAERGLADRATFVEAPAAEYSGSADLVINSGAHQAFGTIPEALRTLRKLVNPGGRLLFADGFWEKVPTDADLATMWPGMTVDDMPTLPDLVDQAIAAGFRPLRVETSTPAEWEEFESGVTQGAEEWLLANGDHPEFQAVRAKVDQSRAFWLRGHRGFMGYAFLTLGVPR